MNYKVNATTVFLTDILSNPGNNKYKIPYNQRPYVWDLNNWQLLWDSLFSKSEKSDFLGSGVIVVTYKFVFVPIFRNHQTNNFLII